MSDTMISVIVPVYNARDSIDDCIKSVLNQSFRDLELILINDGSTDGSLEKCRAWEHDPRVRLICSENCGVSHARNLGLQKATGKWIMFLDSDDYLLDNCLEHLLAMAAPDTQEVIGAYTHGTPEQETPHHQAVTAQTVARMTLDSINNQLLPEFYEVKPLSLSSGCSRLFLKDVIQANTIRFHEELRLSEDTLFNLDYLACIDRVMVTDLPVTFYRINAASVTKVFRAEHLANRFRFFEILTERGYPDAPAHILPLLFFEICKIQRYTRDQERKRLEKEVTGYFSKNHLLLNNMIKS